MVSPFTWYSGNNGYLSPAPLSGTGNTHTSTTFDTLSPTVTVLKGTAVFATGIPSATVVTSSVSTSANVTLSQAATATATGVSYSFMQFPILIGGDSSALANGAATTSSYWNGNGIFRQSNELALGLFGSCFFMSGGTFTPSAGGCLSGWWLPSFDGGTHFESAVSTPSTTVSAISRAPDIIIPLDNAAYAAGSIRYAAGRIINIPPEADCKFVIQNNSGVTLPSTWLIGLAPVASAY